MDKNQQLAGNHRRTGVAILLRVLVRSRYYTAMSAWKTVFNCIEKACNFCSCPILVSQWIRRVTENNSNKHGYNSPCSK